MRFSLVSSVQLYAQVHYCAFQSLVDRTEKPTLCRVTGYSYERRAATSLLKKVDSERWACEETRSAPEISQSASNTRTAN